jgi:hypothetical protein
MISVNSQSAPSRPMFMTVLMTVPMPDAHFAL